MARRAQLVVATLLLLLACMTTASASEVDAISAFAAIRTRTISVAGTAGTTSMSDIRGHVKAFAADASDYADALAAAALATSSDIRGRVKAFAADAADYADALATAALASPLAAWLWPPRQQWAAPPPCTITLVVGGKLSHVALWHQCGLPWLAERAQMHHAADYRTCPLWHEGAGNNSTTTGAIPVNICPTLTTLLPAVDAHSCTPDQAPKAPVCGVLERLLPSAASCKAEDAPPTTCDILVPLLASCPVGSRVRKHSSAGLFAAIAKRLAKGNRRIRARARQACRAVTTSLATFNQRVNLAAHAQRVYRAVTTSLATTNQRTNLAAHAQRAHHTVATAASRVKRAHVVACVSLLACLGCIAFTVVWHRRHTNMLRILAGKLEASQVFADSLVANMEAQRQAAAQQAASRNQQDVEAVLSKKSQRAARITRSKRAAAQREAWRRRLQLAAALRKRSAGHFMRRQPAVAPAAAAPVLLWVPVATPVAVPVAAAPAAAAAAAPVPLPNDANAGSSSNSACEWAGIVAKRRAALEQGVQ